MSGRSSDKATYEDSLRSEGRCAGGVSEAEDVEVLEATFENVDELVVAVGVGGRHKEAGAEDVVVGVRDDALDGFAIVEEDANPEPLHDGGVLMEVERAMAEVAIEGHDEEDGLGVGGGDLLDLTGIREGEADGIEGMLRVVAEELLDGAEFAGLSEAADGVVLKADDDLIGGGRGCRAAARGAYACP